MEEYPRKVRKVEKGDIGTRYSERLRAKSKSNKYKSAPTEMKCFHQLVHHQRINKEYRGHCPCHGNNYLWDMGGVEMISDMPNEILVHIFSFLSLPDRKNTRLVCKRWHRLSYSYSLIKDDAIVVKNNRDLLGTLSCYSKHKNIDIKLKPEDIDGFFDMSPWVTHGRKVREMKIKCPGKRIGGLLAILSHCPNLENLSVTTDVTFKSKPFKDLFTAKVHLPKLLSLKLSGDPDILLPFLKAVTLTAPMLDKFGVQCGYDRWEVFSYALHEDREKVLQAREIRRGYPMVNDEFIHKLTEILCPQFPIKKSDEANEISLTFLTKQCPKLNSLFLGEWPVKKDYFESTFLSLKQLTVVSFLNSRMITDEAVASLSALTSLSHLDLSGCIILTNDGIDKVFGDRVRVEMIELRLFGLFRITDELIVKIAPNLPNLKTLNLGYCSALTEESIVAIAKHNVYLKCLSIQSCSRIIELPDILSLKELVHLNLSFLQSLSGESLRRLKLPLLEVLDWYFMEPPGNMGIVSRLKDSCPSLKFTDCYSYKEKLPCFDENNVLKRKLAILKCKLSPFGSCYMPRTELQWLSRLKEAMTDNNP